MHADFEHLTVLGTELPLLTVKVLDATRYDRKEFLRGNNEL